MDTTNMIRGPSPYSAADAPMQGGAAAPLHLPPHQHHLQGYSKHHHHLLGQPDGFPDPDPRGTPPAADHASGKRDHSKISTSEDDDLEDDGDRGKKTSPWHRMKWTDAMVKLLITIVSYIGEDAASDCAGGRRRKMSLLQKKGKWKLVSRVMAERGFFVSPQQCEDKFNDLNKRYKRLNEILGRGTSCEVVENPALLDVMPLPDKSKEDVRKILSSKHLFYEEMCSYHNGNRLHLPADPSLQHLLQQALHGGEDGDARRGSQDHTADDDPDSDDNDDDMYGDTGTGAGCFHNHKRPRNGGELDMGGGLQDCERGLHSQGITVDINQVFSEGAMPRDGQSQRQWLASRSMQLEEQRLQIQAQMLELESHRFKWQRFSKKKDREIDRLRMENERMKLENEHLALELKRKANEAGLHQFIG